MNGQALLLMRDYLKDMCLQYDDSIHVMVAQRKQGKKFSLSDHVAGLILPNLLIKPNGAESCPILKRLITCSFRMMSKKSRENPQTIFLTESLS